MTGIANWLPVVAASPLLLLIAVEDLRKLQISNRNVLLLLAVFAATAPLLGWTEAAFRLGAGLATFIVCFGMFALRLFAGGDAKFLPAVVLLIPPGSLPAFAFSLSGALLLCVVFVVTLQRTAAASRLTWRAAREPGKMPMGLAISAGALCTPLTVQLLQ